MNEKPDKTNLDAERTKNILGGLLFVIVLASGCFFVADAMSSPHGGANIHGVIIAAVFGLAAGGLFVRLYLPGLAAGFVNFLLWPRRFLKKPAVALSPICAMIERGEYQEAEEKLTELVREYPAHTPAVYLLFQLYLDHLHNRNEAVATAEDFFTGAEDREPSADNLKLLMRYADCAMECGRFDVLINILRTELGSSIYSVPDKSAISCRLIAVQRLQER